MTGSAARMPGPRPGCRCRRRRSVALLEVQRLHRRRAEHATNLGAVDRTLIRSGQRALDLLGNSIILRPRAVERGPVLVVDDPIDVGMILAARLDG